MSLLNFANFLLHCSNDASSFVQSKLLNSFSLRQVKMAPLELCGKRKEVANFTTDFHINARVIYSLFPSSTRLLPFLVCINRHSDFLIHSKRKETHFVMLIRRTLLQHLFSKDGEFLNVICGDLLIDQSAARAEAVRTVPA
ncbi:hypothetical protein V1477_008853 [Vespula maculifrons]|uniref:Uncharacterized protein n=1 Tax=Vespula maculifrons TaxID=7453 RepID=A0ABD2CE61_VESMC